MKTKYKILIFISDYIEANVIPPTVREIGKAVGLKSTSSVSEHLWRLRRDGYISYQPSIPRSIVMFEKGKQMAEFKRWQDEKPK